MSGAQASWYDRHVLPRVVNLVCGAGQVMRMRQKVVPGAEGRVLEVGFGSGHNLPLYDPAKVERLFALEPDPNIRTLAKKRLAESPLEVEILQAGGEAVPLEAASVDTVVVTYSLCTIPEAAAAAGEMRRVLKPGGRLLFLEHGHAPSARIERWQERIEPTWKRLAGGCHLTRHPPSLLQAAGFAPEHEESYRPGVPFFLRFAAYEFWGSARPA